MVKVLVVEQTWTAPGQGGADSTWGNLYGAVDTWCPLFSLHQQESAARRQGLGETIWTYTALCQGKASEADAIVAPLAGSFFAWDRDPAAYEKARAVLAALILGESKGG